MSLHFPDFLGQGVDIDAGVAELADARDSKSRGAICAGSSPATGTMME